MNDLEYKIQLALVDYICKKYPNVEFRSDLGGIRLPMGLAVKAKKLNGGRKAWPDFFLAEPMGIYSGLFIEIKKDREAIYCKDNTMRQDKHTKEQSEKLASLRKSGYRAEFCCGIDECIELVDEYLGGRHEARGL